MREENILEIGYLITAYKNQNQLIDLIKVLSAPNATFFIHIDKKSREFNLHQIIKDIPEAEIFFIKNRIDVTWGGFSQIKSIIKIIESGINFNKKIEYFVLLSNQDFPIKSIQYINEFISHNSRNIYLDHFKIPQPFLPYKGGNGRVEWYWFMDINTKVRFVWRFQRLLHIVFEKYNIKRKFIKGYSLFAGSDWWMVPRDVLEYVLSTIQDNPRIRDAFRNTFIPSEMLIHTILCNNKELRERIINDNKRLILWDKDHTGHPKVLTVSDLPTIFQSDALFARKFDPSVDHEVIDKIIISFDLPH